MTFLLLAVLALFAGSASAGPPGDFYKVYSPGGVAVGKAIDTTTDGGYVVAEGSTSVSVLKLDANGEVDWRKRYRVSSDDEAKDVIQTSDGGYVLVSQFSPERFKVKFWVMRLDAAGEVLWAKTFDSGDRFAELGKKVIETASGHFVVLARTNRLIGDTVFFDPLLFKLDGAGTVVWQRTYEAPAGAELNDLAELPDGSFVMTGLRFGDLSSPEDLVWVLRVGPDGTVLANGEMTYQGVPSWGLADAKSIISTSDGGFAVAGQQKKSPTASNNDVWVLKLNADLSVQWDVTVGGNLGDDGRAIVEVADGYVVAADVPFDQFRSSFLLFKLDRDGDIVWQRTTNLDSGIRLRDLVATPDGGFAFTGRVRSSLFTNNTHVMKTNSAGEMEECDSIEAAVTDVGTTNATGTEATTNSSDFQITPTDVSPTVTDTNTVAVQVCPVLDTDEDGVPDLFDNCPFAANAHQLDTDDDGLGDACDPDDDNDGLTDEEEAALGTDPLDPDTDDDGRRDDRDGCPLEGVVGPDLNRDGCADARPSNMDSVLVKNQKNHNFGTDPALGLDKKRRIVVGIDLDGVDLRNLVSAKLVLSVEPGSTCGWDRVDGAVNIHRLREDFTEGKGAAGSTRTDDDVQHGCPARDDDGDSGDEGSSDDDSSSGDRRPNGSGPGVTWNCATDSEIANRKTDCDVKWKGGNFAPQATGSVLHTDGLVGQVAWDVTSDVESGVNAWLLQTTKHGGNVSYYSREGAATLADPALLPRLVLKYCVRICPQ